MKLGDLQVFRDVVTAGGMTQAAEVRGSSQPAVSRTVRDLETRLGARLLRRTGRGVELTSAGERFLAFVDETLAGFEKTRIEVRELSSTLPARLSVGVPLRMGRLVIPDLQRRFVAAMPESDTHIYEDSSERMAKALRDRRFDLAIAYHHSAALPADAEDIRQESLYLVGHPSIVGQETRPIALAEAAPMPLLLPSGTSYRTLIDQAFRRAALTPHVARQLETSEALLAFAMELEGVAILPYSNVYAECDQGDLVARLIVEPRIGRRLCLLTGRHVDHRLAKAASQVLRQGLDALSAQARWEPVAAD